MENSFCPRIRRHVPLCPPMSHFRSYQSLDELGSLPICAAGCVICLECDFHLFNVGAISFVVENVDRKIAISGRRRNRALFSPHVLLSKISHTNPNFSDETCFDGTARSFFFKSFIEPRYIYLLGRHKTHHTRPHAHTVHEPATAPTPAWLL